MLRRLGYRAICIAGRDLATGTLPRWHRPDDMPEAVSEEVMGPAADFVMAALQEVSGTADAPRTRRGLSE